MGNVADQLRNHYYPAYNDALVKFYEIQTALFLTGGFIAVVGWTRSQATLGHVLFGFQVVDHDTGKPIKMNGLLARFALSHGFEVIAALMKVMMAQHLMEVLSSLSSGTFAGTWITALINITKDMPSFIHYIICLLCAIQILVCQDSRHFIDQILNQQVIIKPKD